MNETLSEDDAGKILEELLDAQNHAHLLGLMMNVKPRDVEAIQTTYQQPKDRLLHIIIAFLRQAEPRPTWRAIVDALKSSVVGLTALARRVEATHFPDPTSTRDVLPENTGMSSSVPFISDWCSHVSIISDTEPATSTTHDGDDEVKSETPSQLCPTTGGSECDAQLFSISCLAQAHLYCDYDLLAPCIYYIFLSIEAPEAILTLVLSFLSTRMW